MSAKTTLRKARRDLKQGKSPSTAAGEFVHQEIERVRQGKRGARSPRQAIAIGLNEARRAGIPLKPPQRASTKASTRKSAGRAYRKGQDMPAAKPSPQRSRSRSLALKRKPTGTSSRTTLSPQARPAAQRRKRAA